MKNEMITPCKCCGENTISHYLRILGENTNSILEARRDAMSNNKNAKCSFPLPTVFGAKGYATYEFDINEFTEFSHEPDKNNTP